MNNKNKDNDIQLVLTLVLGMILGAFASYNPNNGYKKFCPTCNYTYKIVNSNYIVPHYDVIPKKIRDYDSVDSMNKHIYIIKQSHDTTYYGYK